MILAGYREGSGARGVAKFQFFDPDWPPTGQLVVPDKENSMPGRGPAPKRYRSDRSKNPEMTKLVSGDKPYGFPLPVGYLGVDKDGQKVKWHAATRRWWEHWRRSPQASRMLSAPDWDYLLSIAVLHHRMWTDWNRMSAAQMKMLAEELRLAGAKYGATPEDRMRLKAEIDSPEQAPVGQVIDQSVFASIQERRQRLLTVVA